MRRWLWALALTSACIATSHAQLPRTLPPNGKLGELVGQQQPFPLLQINDKIVRLAPGGRIYDQNNRTILHISLPERAHVLFTEDMYGNVLLVYILRAEELEQLRQPR
jgi:hypothetical protein